MPKQVCFSLFIVLSLLVNCSISADSSQQIAPTASQSANPPGANITNIVTGSNETLPGENVSTLSNSNLTTDVQTKGAQNVFDQQLASSPSVNADPTVQTKGDDNISTSPSPSILGTRDTDSVSQENTSVPLSSADPPAAATKGSGIEDIVQENTSLPPTVETKGDNNIPTSPSPSIVDNSILDTRDMDSVSQENTSVPFSNADPPVAETKESSIEDLVQENTSLPPTVETKEGGNNVSRENTLVPPSISPAYINTPAFETSDDGSFTQENQSPPPSNMVSENVPQLNDYSSQPNNVVPAPSEALSYPELDPTMQSTPSNDDTYNTAPTSNQHTILPFNYRAEDEPVEPYEEEEDSWNRANGAVAGVLVGACVIGVGGFLYQKRKKDNVRAHQYQYQCLGKKEGV
ncbi:hypothetical protein HRI_000793700 [Hibiscus trionum]|uniref:Uncharacterized protein n=1 Tax=Hibiscus trionum TaxID=183268 RepID=A0A9W7H563_HIBTR|nr:hypothetical protein HRI_000793700 [Hibiscus trionum]